MDTKTRLLWAATMMLTIATTAANGRTINSSNSDGVDGGNAACPLDPNNPNNCPPPPPPPPPVFSAGCESTFLGPGTQDFDCSDYSQGAAPSLSGAQGVLAQFKAVTPLDLYGNAVFAQPNFRSPDIGVLDALMGAGSSNTDFDAVFDGATRQGRIQLGQRLAGEFMVGLGGTWGASGAETPWSAYFFFTASPGNVAGSAIEFTLPPLTANFANFQLTGLSIFTSSQPVPEPGGLLLVGTAVAALVAVTRRRPAAGSARGAARAAESAAAPPGR